MKIYLAAQFARRDELAALIPMFEAAGHTITSSWLRQATPLNGRMDNHTATDNRKYATQDLSDIEDADAVVLFTEDPLVGIPRGARHVEFGYAVRAGLLLALVGPRENVFHWLLPDKAVHASVNDLLAQENFEGFGLLEAEL